jgi:protein-S-isoprenylcysteine O-methyltransferase Ste14
VEREGNRKSRAVSCAREPAWEAPDAQREPDLPIPDVAARTDRDAPHPAAAQRSLGAPLSAMEEQRDAAAVQVFPPGVPLLTILLGVGLDRLWPIDPGFALAAPVRYGIGGAIVAGAIVGLGWRAVRLFRRSGQSENPWKPTPSLVESGPFRFTRNPMYLQMLLACVGFAVLLWNAWILALVPLAAWVLQRFAILPEEAYLERKFGDAYLAYKRRVRRWI